MSETQTGQPDVEAEMGTARSSRRLRGLALIALAGLAIGVAGLTYLRPSLGWASKATTSVPRPLVIPSPDPLLSASEVDALVYDFVSPTVGWALDAGNQPLGLPTNFWVFQTVDGAKHWHKQFAGRAALDGPIRLQFFDAYHGFVFPGDPSTFYSTSDGGAHWKPIAMPDQSVPSAEFTDPLHGWFLQAVQSDPNNPAYSLLSTSDGGTTWTHLAPLPADANGLTVRSPVEIWLGTTSYGRPHVYLSQDSGQTWVSRPVPLPPGADPSLSPLCAAAGVGLLPHGGVFTQVGCKGSASTLTSFDLGATWNYLPPPPPDGTTLARIRFQDDLHWWLMAGGDLYKSSDGGQTWTHVALQLDDWEYLPQPLDAKHAWAQLVILGPLPPGTFHRLSGLAMTSDGGVHWTRVRVPHPS